jgi:PAS domain S-box-containing protein
VASGGCGEQRNPVERHRLTDGQGKGLDRMTDLRIVAVVAPSGSIESVLELSSLVPRESRLTRIFYVRVSRPEYERLRAALGPGVARAGDGDRLEPGRSYLMPADAIVGVDRGRFRIRPLPAQATERAQPLDHLLCSIARAAGSRAAVAFLGEIEGDGGAGIQAIEEAGGLALVFDRGRRGAEELVASQGAILRINEDLEAINSQLRDQLGQLEELRADLERANRELDRHGRQQAALARLGARALHSGIRELFDETCDVVRATLGLERTELLALEDRDRGLVVAAGSGPGADIGSSIGMEAPIARLLRRSGLLAVRDADPDLATPPRLRELGIESSLFAPIRDRDQVYGAIGAHASRGRRFDADEMAFLSAVADMLAGAVSREKAVALLHHSEQRHRRQRDELASIYDTAPVGLAILDRPGRVVKLNRFLADLVGIDPDRHENEPAWSLIEETLAPLVTRMFATGERCLDILQATDAAGYQAWWMCSVAPLSWRADRFEEASCVVHDMTDQIRSEEAVRDASRRKDEFLALLGHELRNPLAAIAAAAELRGARSLEPERRAELDEIISRQVAHMKRLIDGLLDLTRIGRGTIEIERASVDLGAVVREAVEAQEIQAPEGLRIVVEHGDGPLRVEGDRERLFQVVTNLIGNSIKFTPPPGRIEILVSREGEAAVVRVRDEGVGIEPDLLEHLFEPFRQGDHHAILSAGGLGLGLSLAHRIAELHGGALTARSEGPGAGAELELSIPLAAVEVAEEVSPLDPPADRRALRIVVIEDNRDVARVIVALLGIAGHDVTVAHDGESGLAAVAEHDPDVVVCDLGLPGKLDGYDVGRRLAKNGDGRERVLLALSGYGTPDAVARARRAGFHEHLTKPTSGPEIEEAIARCRAN